MYTYKEVYEATKEYFQGNELLTDIWLSKYTLKDKQGNYYELTPEGRINLIVDELVRIESSYNSELDLDSFRERVFGLIKDFKYFIPGGSIIYGLGNKKFLSSLGNCFVIGNEVDSYGSICKIDEEQVQLMKRRGGVGHDLSHLRPKGVSVNGCANTSTGSVSFAPRYSNSTREVAQDGRRGALMLTHHINHPDIEDFVTLKDDVTKVTGANISVKLTDEFMTNVKEDKDHEFRFPVSSEYSNYKKSAREVFQKIVHQAWKNGEPGVLFWDKIIKESPADCYPGFETKSTNPCFTGDMLLLLSEGYKTFSELNEEKIKKGYFKDEYAINELGEKVKYNVWSNGYKHVIKLTLDNKKYLECTPGHIFKLIDGSECEARYTIGKIIKGFDRNDSKVTQIIDNGELKEVFDFNLTGDNHWGVVGGLIAHNCGELPLSPYDSCRLGHLNLYAYIDNPYTPESSFNKQKFEEDVLLVQRLMDNIIDLEEEKINEILIQIQNSYDDESSKRVELQLWEKIKMSLLSGRRTGLGVCGEADAVAALNLRYSSEQANNFIIEIHKILALKSYESSIVLAKERGSFPIWKLKIEKDNLFINRILNELREGWDLEKGQDNPLIWDYEKYGRRNISNLTIAPTGTTAQLVDRQGVSSGIEPVFEVFYKRRRKINPNDKFVKVDFTDEVGDKWEEYYVIHPGFRRWYDINWYKIDKQLFNLDFHKPLEDYSEGELSELVKKSPYYRATANEIDVISKIKLQGEVQKWIDHSISVTHNLLKETTEEEVGEFFLKSWESGCKGMTVYRDGSRAGVLVKSKIEDEVFAYVDAKPRPEILNCEIHRLQSRGQYFFILVGILSGNPYEIFVIDEKQFPSCLRIASSQTLRGQIMKRKSRIYDLITTRPDNSEPVLIKDIVSLMGSDDDKTDTKRFSLELRHRISPKEIVETIEKSCGDITAFEKAIARVLKKYIKEGESSGLICSNCGSRNMTYSGGCLRCKDCGDSKCS